LDGVSLGLVRIRQLQGFLDYLQQVGSAFAFVDEGTGTERCPHVELLDLRGEQDYRWTALVLQEMLGCGPGRLLGQIQIQQDGRGSGGAQDRPGANGARSFHDEVAEPIGQSPQVFVQFSVVANQHQSPDLGLPPMRFDGHFYKIRFHQSFSVKMVLGLRLGAANLNGGSG